MLIVMSALLFVTAVQALSVRLEPMGLETAIGQPVGLKRRVLVTASAVVMLTFISASKAIVLQNGPDLLGYSEKFQSMAFATYDSLVFQYLEGNLKDIGFYLFSKVACDMGMTPQIWMGLIALIYASAIGYFIFNYSTSPAMSFAIVVSYFFSFTLTGLRQTMAMSLVLVAYVWYLRDRYLLCGILILFAGFFHSSAWIALLVFLTPLLYHRRTQFIVILISFLIVTFAPSIVRLLISTLAWNNSLSSYAVASTTLNWTGYIIQFSMYVFCLVVRIKEHHAFQDLGKTAEFGLALMSMGLVFQSAASIVAEAFRISFYFSMGAITTVPIYIGRIRDGKVRTAVYGLVFLMLFTYIILSGSYEGFLFVWDIG